MAIDREARPRLISAVFLAAVVLSVSIVALERRGAEIPEATPGGGETPASEGEPGETCWGCSTWLPPLGSAPGFRIGPRDVEEVAPFRVVFPPSVPDGLILAEVAIELPRQVCDEVRRLLPEEVRGEEDVLINLSEYPEAIDFLRGSRVDGATVWIFYVPPDYWKRWNPMNLVEPDPLNITYEDVLSTGGLVIEENYLANRTEESARKSLEILGEHSDLAKVSPIDLLLERDPTISRGDVLNYTVSEEGGVAVFRFSLRGGGYAEVVAPTGRYLIEACGREAFVHLIPREGVKRAMAYALTQGFTFFSDDGRTMYQMDGSPLIPEDEVLEMLRSMLKSLGGCGEGG